MNESDSATQVAPAGTQVTVHAALCSPLPLPHPPAVQKVCFVGTFTSGGLKVGSVQGQCSVVSFMPSDAGQQEVLVHS